MSFLIGSALGFVIYGVLWAFVFLWAKNGVPSSKAYANAPEKQAELLQTPLPRLWTIFLHTPLRFVVAIAAPGAIILIFALMQIAQVFVSTSVWPSASGTVSTSQVIPNAESTGYVLEFEYQFTANQQQYRGQQITFDDIATLTQNAANALQAKYPKGSTVTVHYDPQLPYNSVLDPQLGSRTWTLLAIAVLLTIVGTPFFALYLRALRWARLYREVAAMQPRDDIDFQAFMRRGAV